MLLARILNSTFRWGELTIVDAHGNRHRFTGEVGLKSTIRVHYSLATSLSLTFGEAYMDGTLTIEEGDLSDYLAIAVANMYALDRHWSQRLKKSNSQSLKGLAQYNSAFRAR